MSDLRKKLATILKRGYADDSQLLSDNKTELIGLNKKRQPGQLRYLHGLYAGLSNEMVAKLESLIDRRLPPALRSFYGEFNGLFLYGESFSVGGYRHDWSRKLDDSAWQPISLEYGNTKDRPLVEVSGEQQFADNSDSIRFAVVGDSEAELYMRLDGDLTVYASPRYQIGPLLYRWTNLEQMLLSEAERLLALQLKRGIAHCFEFPLPPAWIEQDLVWTDDGWGKS